MFWKIAGEPLRRSRNRRRAAIGVAAIALGCAVAAAMLSVALDVGDRMGNELRSLGANITISPAADSLPVEIGGTDYRPSTEGAYLQESSLPMLKQIFWRNNIVAVAPLLYAAAKLQAGSAAPAEAMVVGTWFNYPLVNGKEEEFRTGISAVNPTWKMDGQWPRDSSTPAEAAVGQALARKLGLRRGMSAHLVLNGPAQPTSPVTVLITGIVSTGGAEDEQVMAPLEALQSWTGLAGKVRKAQVSALIKPEDALSRRNPQVMTPAEYDRWYCSPYLSSIVHQIGEALPDTSARAVRQVSDTQGNVLGKLNFLMALLAVVALVAATLSISSLAHLTVVERRQEIGVMKALGAQDWLVHSFFLVEMAAQGALGGLLGFGLGQLLAQFLGHALFSAPVSLHWLVLPAILLVAVGVSTGGAWVAVRRAAREQPARALQGI